MGTGLLQGPGNEWMESGRGDGTVNDACDARDGGKLT